MTAERGLGPRSCASRLVHIGTLGRMTAKGKKTGSGQMRAAVYSSTGTARDVLRVEQVQRPRPKRGELLVRVVAASVNVVDIKLRKVTVSSLARPLPKTPGCDIAGFVQQAPRESKFDEGDRIFAMLQKVFTSRGGCAEYAVVPEKDAARAPAISLVYAASLPLVALTTLQGIDSVDWKRTHSQRNKQQEKQKGDHDGSSEQLKCLVQAGSGGLGSFAVQYCAHVLGMNVCSTCSASNAEFVKSLGASRIIDYRSEDFASSVSGMHLVFDPIAYATEAKTWNSNVMTSGAHYVSIASSSWDQTRDERDPFNLAVPEARFDWVALEKMRAFKRNNAARLGSGGAWHYGPVFVEADGPRLERVRRLVEEGKIMPQVERVYPLEQIAEAHEHVESGHTRGKVVVQITTEEQRLEAQEEVAAKESVQQSAEESLPSSSKPH